MGWHDDGSRLVPLVKVLNTGKHIARSDAEPLPAGKRFALDMDVPSFGSAHNGVLNALLGDGSVQGITRTSTSIFLP